MRDNLIEPRVQLRYKDRFGKTVGKYTSPRRAKIFVTSEAKDFLKRGSVRVRVIYSKPGKELIDNEGVYENGKDLRMALDAFLEKGLWLKAE